MKLKSKDSKLFFLDDQVSQEDSFARVTHLGIGAHQDDLEVMASHGIMHCLEKPHLWFGGITCTNGAGSARAGDFADHSDKEMVKTRMSEQIDSAKMGRYSVMAQMGYPSQAIKKELNTGFVDELADLINACKPAFIYTHNLADKHDTHVAVTMSVIAALKKIHFLPEYFYGCEVWRTLDWLPDHRKTPLEIHGEVKTIKKLIECHKSQTIGGKRYDLAVEGRMKSNATFFESHSVDKADNLWFAMDLKPLLENKDLEAWDFMESFINEFKSDVSEKIKRFS